MKRRHIVVVDGAWGGHHPFYLKAFAKVLLEAGYRVSVLCPAPEDMSGWLAGANMPEGAEFAVHYFSNQDVRQPGPILRRLAPPVVCLARWSHLSAALKKIFTSGDGPDLVFFAWLDIYLHSRFLPAWLIDRLFPFAWSGLYFHPRHHRAPQQSPAPSMACPERLVAKSARACALAVLDAGVVHKLRAQLGDKPVFVFPDFSDETPPREHDQLVEQIRQKAGSRKIIGLLGGMTRRKGVLTLLEMARHPMAQDWYFVFAGELARQTFSEQELREINQLVEEPRGNCFAAFGRIADDAQFNALVSACDVIFAVYQGFPHSSNLVTKAAAYGKNVLVSSGGYMEEVVRQHDLGEVVPAEDVEAALAALGRLTAQGSARKRAAGMQAYAEEQSQDKLRQVLLGLVEGCASKGASQ